MAGPETPVSTPTDPAASVEETNIAAARRMSAGTWLAGPTRGSNLAIKVASAALLLIVWQMLAITQGPNLVPGPISVVERFWEVVLYEDFFFHVRKTLFRVLAGLGISLVVAVAVGVPMGMFRPVERFLETYVLLGLTIPGLSWALIAVMIVGINDWAPVLAIVATTSPMVLLNLWQGTKSIDMDVLEMGRAFRADRMLVVRDVVLPQLLPFVLAGTRLGLALAWKIVVLAELFGLSNGVGYQLSVNFARFSINGVVAWTVGFTIVMGLIEFAAIRPIERHVTRWRPSIQGA